MRGHDITTQPAGARIRIEVDGEIVAESDDVIALSETGLPTRYYFPPQDVRPEFLRESNAHTVCPFKGTASYHDLHTPSGEHAAFVWHYPEPIEGVEAIRGRLAFYNDRVSVFVDGEPEG